MPMVVGLSFRSAGQMHYYDPGGLELHEGDAVIAPTPRGTELGQVMTELREVADRELELPLRVIKRKANSEDLRREEENRDREREAFDIAAERIHQHGLPMKLVEAHLTFDRTRIVFYFSSEGRVDFRQLVRALASELRTRVELHQVGVRDEAKLIGGFGPCGRPLCCATFLSTLQPVAIKMAKEQNLALNPLKISGVCGRLMCCLSYEYECYRRAKAEMPRVGSDITLPQGAGRVVEVNAIKHTVTVALENGTRVEINPECPCGNGGERPCAAGEESQTAADRSAREPSRSGQAEGERQERSSRSPQPRRGGDRSSRGDSRGAPQAAADTTDAGTPSAGAPASGQDAAGGAPGQPGQQAPRRRRSRRSRFRKPRQGDGSGPAQSQ